MPQLAQTSVPLWVAPGSDRTAAAAPDTSGSTYLLVGVGEAARPVLRGWAEELTATGVEAPAVRVVEADDIDTAQVRLVDALAESRVGVRLRLAGAVGACLALRGTAVTAGLQDDELHVAPTGPGPIHVHCVHCAAATSVAVQVGDVVPCTGCGRSLLVYHHVSRRSGRFLGFMVDAETAPKDGTA